MTIHVLSAMSRFAAYSRADTDVPYFSGVTSFLPAKGPGEQTTVRRLFVDSRDRYGYPAGSAYNFKVYLGNDPERSVGISGYENVTSVELKAVAFPKVANERYVIVSIDELNDDMLDATCSSAHNAFGIVYFDSDALAAGQVKPLKGVDFYQKQLLFRPPLAKLNSLSVKFLKHDGTAVGAADTGGAEANVSLVLEITSKSNRTL